MLHIYETPAMLIILPAKQKCMISISFWFDIHSGSLYLARLLFGY